MDENIKKGFAAWESATNKYFEEVLTNPAVLKSLGSIMSSGMSLMAMRSKAATAVWGALGLATKQDQERTLHSLNQLQTLVMDLEEKIEKVSERR